MVITPVSAVAPAAAAGAVLIFTYALACWDVRTGGRDAQPVGRVGFSCARFLCPRRRSPAPDETYQRTRRETSRVARLSQ